MLERMLQYLDNNFKGVALVIAIVTWVLLPGIPAPAVVLEGVVLFIIKVIVVSTVTLGLCWALCTIRGDKLTVTVEE